MKPTDTVQSRRSSLRRTAARWVAVGLASCASLALAVTYLVPSAPTPQSDTAQGGEEASRTRWGASYFPNIELTTHQGDNVRFFDDLIKDKVVVINFIYTSCPDTCPLETARLAQVYKILGDRVGDDVFFYSITIDPDNDTPDVLAAYAQRYGAGPGWTFLTGNEAEIVELRKKLGLYIPEIQSDDSNNHNLSLIIGNQATGQWMKRSPFENPHVLATQVGSWLHNWKLPTKERRDFADAPKLRSVSDGERLFRTRCAACHTIGGAVVGTQVATNDPNVGPDLLDVDLRRDPAWLRRWIAEPDVMLAEQDPLALQLLAAYNDVAMPNMRLGGTDIADLLGFVRAESSRIRRVQRAREAGRLGRDHSARERRLGTLGLRDAWVREAPPKANVSAGYLTLVNHGEREARVVGAQSPLFEHVEFHEMVQTDGGMGMRPLDELVVPASGELRLETGGKHLMLIGPQQALAHGKKVPVRLQLASGKGWDVWLPVVAPERGRPG
ncbi:MAG: copper chaperone PCu(A)C [Myxococcales bacterium FL481]|nr:MAG: copper chaperone PCu(A)C [Myxococcales bacterium FL481]